MGLVCMRCGLQQQEPALPWHESPLAAAELPLTLLLLSSLLLLWCHAAAAAIARQGGVSAGRVVAAVGYPLHLLHPLLLLRVPLLHQLLSLPETLLRLPLM